MARLAGLGAVFVTALLTVPTASTASAVPVDGWASLQVPHLTVPPATILARPGSHPLAHDVPSASPPARCRRDRATPSRVGRAAGSSRTSSPRPSVS
jgi:hypothetical protein